jgi:2-polyprenyl-3-methyl-5-hydroxy-6-metoxy-1,4-benzoquinol methylase
MNSEMHEFYNQGLYTSVSQATRSASPTFQQVLGLFTAEPCAQLLDIGCSDGFHTSLIRERLGNPHTIGVDIGLERLKDCQQRNIDTLVGDPATALLGFRDASFDCIHCGEVIEHVFAPDQLLRNIHRLLKPGGYAVLSTPNLASWRNRIALMLGWQPFWSEVSSEVLVGNPRCSGQPSGHIRLFTPRALRALVQRHGLRVERMIGLAYLQNVSSPDLTAWLADSVDRFLPRLNPELGDGIAVRLRRDQ